MKMLILTQYYPPEFGAAPRRLSGLAERFVAHGHEVSVLAPMPNYPMGRMYPGYGGVLQREDRNGVHVMHTFVYPTQKADLLRRLTNYFSFVLSSSILGTLLLKKPDYLFVESPPLFLGLAGYWLSRLKRTRWIFNVSDLWPESVVSLGKLSRESLAFRLSRKLEEFFYRKAWLVTGQAKSILSDICSRLPDLHTFHLSNGVDTSKYDASRRTAEGRALLGGPGECVALYAGLHGLAQGLDQVLDAAQKMLPEKGCRFVLAGDGPEKESLKERATRLKLTNTRFLDALPVIEMPGLIASADIILVTLKVYLPGAVPSKLYEAMASGVPVVLVAEGEAVDIVRRHHAGIVVKPGDIDGLANAIRLLRDTPLLRQEMGANGRRAAVDHHDSMTIADRFIEYLEKGTLR